MKTKSSLLLLGLLFAAAAVARADDTAPAIPPADAAHPHRAELLKRFDKNGDGKLDDAEKAEAKKFAQEHKGEAKDELLKRFDKNGDGKLDESEKAEAKKWAKEHRKHPKKNKGAVESDEKPAAST